LAYATVSTGFKGGGVTARPFTKAQAKNGTFTPETLTAYEGGLKTDLFDRKLRLNLSGFYNDYKNIQLPIGDCSLLDGFAVGPIRSPARRSRTRVTGIWRAPRPN
jgi:iron complex outermembrane receptor protein